MSVSLSVEGIIPERSVLTQTMTHKKRRVRGNEIGFSEKKWFENKILKRKKDEQRLKEASSPYTESSKDIFVYWVHRVLRSPFPKSK